MDEENNSPTSVQIPDKVCTPCLELNLTQDGIIDKFIVCATCAELFCLHGASHIDPKYCAHCCSDFKVVDIQETVIRETHNDAGQITSAKHFNIRHLILTGYHWLFYNRAISKMTDIELDHAIEYHHAIFNGMLAERDARRVAHFQRNKGKHAGNESKSLLVGDAVNPLIQTGAGAQFSVSRSTTRTTRTRTTKTTQSGTSADAAMATAQAAMQQLLKSGMSKEQIAALFGSKK